MLPTKPYVNWLIFRQSAAKPSPIKSGSSLIWSRGIIYNLTTSRIHEGLSDQYLL